MTAFSRSSEETSWGSLVWELRSVNQRYLDVVIKLPEELRSIENEVRKRLNEVIKRGKVECNLRYKATENQQSQLSVNDEYVDEVLRACHIISKKSRQPSELNVMEILKWPGVLDPTERDLNPVINSALTLFDEAIKSMLESRESEGQRLQVMIEERCKAMTLIVSNERQRHPLVLEKTREKLLKKVEELKADYDRDRLEQELVYMTQKMDVDEELDRIESHFVEVEKIFKRNEPVGRRLDFIMQEFNREANTLGSKSTDIETTQAAVELKVLIEQMREQVQNIE